MIKGRKCHGMTERKSIAQRRVDSAEAKHKGVFNTLKTILAPLPPTVIHEFIKIYGDDCQKHINKFDDYKSLKHFIFEKCRPWLLIQEFRVPVRWGKLNEQKPRVIREIKKSEVKKSKKSVSLKKKVLIPE